MMQLNEMTRARSPSQSFDKVVLLQEHIERLLQERKVNQVEIQKLKALAEEQQEKIRELQRRLIA